MGKTQLESFSLKVRVNSPDKLLWQGEAVSVSSQNTEGAFDILPLHANLTTITGNFPIVVTTTKGETMNFSLNQSVIQVKGDVVNIYSGI